MLHTFLFSQSFFQDKRSVFKVQLSLSFLAQPLRLILISLLCPLKNNLGTLLQSWTQQLKLSPVIWHLFTLMSPCDSLTSHFDQHFRNEECQKFIKTSRFIRRPKGNKSKFPFKYSPLYTRNYYGCWPDALKCHLSTGSRPFNIPKLSPYPFP